MIKYAVAIFSIILCPLANADMHHVEDMGGGFYSVDGGAMRHVEDMGGGFYMND